MGQMRDAIEGIRTFITEVKVELRKSSWPDRSELLESSAVVIVTFLMLGVFVGISDEILITLIRLLVR